MSKRLRTKKAPPKKVAAKRRAKKAPAKPKSRGGRPRTDPAKLDAAIAAVRRGVPKREAADEAGISPRVLYRALEGRELDEELDAGAVTEIDPDADPLDIARALLARATRDMAGLRADSPRLNPARGESRALVKLIAALKRERDSEETPEQAKERKRREDAETRKMVEQYVLQYEREAAELGVCVHCGQPRPSPAGGTAR